MKNCSILLAATALAVLGAACTAPSAPREPSSTAAASIDESILPAGATVISASYASSGVAAVGSSCLSGEETFDLDLTTHRLRWWRCGEPQDARGIKHPAPPISKVLALDEFASIVDAVRALRRAPAPTCRDEAELMTLMVGDAVSPAQPGFFRADDTVCASDDAIDVPVVGLAALREAFRKVTPPAPAFAPPTPVVPPDAGDRVVLDNTSSLGIDVFTGGTTPPGSECMVGWGNHQLYLAEGKPSHLDTTTCVPVDVYGHLRYHHADRVLGEVERAAVTRALDNLTVSSELSCREGAPLLQLVTIEHPGHARVFLDEANGCFTGAGMPAAAHMAELEALFQSLGAAPRP